jgi:NAD(P)-dependent dehydrogenase (short-subunit alcohol dehydrogenase family)
LPRKTTLKNAASDDIAIVTGAGSGIGRALAIVLSWEPVTVLAVGRREALLRETAGLAQGEVRVVAADVGEESGRSRILSEVPEGSRIKYLIHAAGVCFIERTTEITLESWRRTMATNVDGRLFLTLRLLPRLKEGSRVLFVGSNSATTPRKGSVAYCVSKAASYMLQECLKLELAREGIIVSSAIPSPVNTPLLIDQMAADSEVFPDGFEYRKLQAEGRLIAPATVARFYRWLLTKVPAGEYSARQWDIQDESHHRFWLGKESLFR